MAAFPMACSAMGYQQQTEWVLISTGMFMSYLFEPEFGVVDLQKDGGASAR